MRAGAGHGRTRRLALVLMLACIAADAPPPREPVAVIVSDGWAGFASIDLATLRSLYLGRRTRWQGQRVHPFGLPPGSPARAAFSDAVLGRSEEDLDRFWIEQALLGGALPPREVAGPAEMIQAVQRTPGAIGYLPLGSLRRADAAGVRVIGIATDAGVLAPPAPAYPIRLPAATTGDAR